MDSAKLILNPARLRIIQYLRLQGSVRTSDLVEHLGDIPRATVYHHVRILEENKIIKVIKENRVRGAVEKHYALEEETVGKTSIAASAAFHIGLMQEMGQYFGGKDRDHRKDKVFFTSALLRVTDGEYARLLKDIAALLKPFAERAPGTSLSLRKLSIISSPPESGGSQK